MRGEHDRIWCSVGNGGTLQAFGSSSNKVGQYKVRTRSHLMASRHAGRISSPEVSVLQQRDFAGDDDYRKC